MVELAMRANSDRIYAKSTQFGGNGNINSLGLQMEKGNRNYTGASGKFSGH